MMATVSKWTVYSLERGRVFGSFFCCLVRDSGFDGPRVIGLFFAETFLVTLFDEERQRQFPSLLLVSVEFAESFRIHPEFSRHLHLGMAQVKFSTRFDP